MKQALTYRRISKSCIICDTPFSVPPSLDRIKCCSNPCARKLAGNTMRGRPLKPAIRPCLDCGKVAELYRARCQQCFRARACAVYRKSKPTWTEERKAKYRAISRRSHKRWMAAIKSDPIKREEYRLKEIEHCQRRRALIKSVRVERVSFRKILDTFGMVCHVCGGDITKEQLSFDHVIPLARGGAHSTSNLKPAHKVCNQRKSARLLEEL